MVRPMRAEEIHMRTRRALRADAHIRLFTYMTRQEQIMALCAYHALYQRLTDPGLLGTLLLSALEFLLGKVLPSTLVDYVVGVLDDIRRQDLLDCSKQLES